jgi:hypothetical protein
MPIIKRTHGHDSADQHGSIKKFFEGRVLKVVVTTESRNWSPTLDYSDHRPTSCTWALVYIGTHGVPSRKSGSPGRRMVADLEPTSWQFEYARDLEIGERYGWIDCTNLFSDLTGYTLEAEVDPFDMQLLHGGPEMIEGVGAWEAFHTDRWAAEEAAREAKLAAEAAQLAAVNAKKAARQAAIDAKLAAAKSLAEGQLARIPAKGTTVTVDGFTGKVFWTGVSKYRGAWNARAGVKDTKGNVQWIDAEKFA